LFIFRLETNYFSISINIYCNFHRKVIIFSLKRINPAPAMFFNFWSILITFTVGLLGLGQLHDYIVTGKVSDNYGDAPELLRSIVESHDLVNARRLVEAASYADAAGQYAVIPGNIKKTVDRLTGRIERDQFDESPVHVSVVGLTDSECLRAARFLTFKGDHLVLRDEPTPPPVASSADIAAVRAKSKSRMAVSRPIGTNSGFGA
jgi:hypothetical protein